MSNTPRMSRIVLKPLQYRAARAFASSGSNKENTSKISQEKKPKQQKQVNVNTGDYKAPEYYQHNSMSFNDLMVAMQKFRLPQPSNNS